VVHISSFSLTHSQVLVDALYWVLIFSLSQVQPERSNRHVSKSGHDRKFSASELEHNMSDDTLSALLLLVRPGPRWGTLQSSVP